MIPTHRDELPRFFTSLGFTGWGAEIGTYDGRFAAHLLGNWGGSLHCVDPYVHQPAWRDMLNHDDAGFDRVHRAALLRLDPWITRGRCLLHRLTSHDASGLWWANGLDFVYLDARHDYASVAHDLRAWWPAVRAGGFFGGHDFLHETSGNTVYEVQPAVEDWMREIGLPPHRLAVIRDSHYPTWYVSKDAETA